MSGRVRCDDMLTKPSATLLGLNKMPSNDFWVFIRRRATGAGSKIH